MTDGDRDEDLLADLAGMFRRAEPVPEHAVEAAKASFSLGSLDLELALLTWDSEVDQGVVGMREATDTAAPGAVRATRTLTFEHDELAIDVEVAVVAQGSSGDPGQGGPGQGAPGYGGPAGTARLHGQLELGESGCEGVRLGLEQASTTEGQTRAMEVDRLGRFGVDGIEPGLFRLVVRREGRPAVASAWFRVP